MKMQTEVVITGLEDVNFVPTPVKYCRRGKGGKEEWRTEDQQRAVLFAEAKPCDVTMITMNISGDPFLKIGRLTSAIIRPRPAGGHSPWEIAICITPPRKRQPEIYNRDFPSDAVLLLRGHHDIALTDLPPLTSPLRWHCVNFAPTWREVARRCRAIPGAVWIDTTESAVNCRQANAAKELERRAELKAWYARQRDVAAG